VNYIGPQGVVTVQNGSGAQVNQTPAGRHVTVTPLIAAPTARVISAPSPQATPTHTALRKLLTKAVRKGEKKDSGKIFTLRNVSPTSFSKVEDLKSLIKAQLSGDLVDRFDVGYVKATEL
jgi:hypothetical protein